MRLTQVLQKHNIGRRFNDLWKRKKDVTVNDRNLRKAIEADGKQVYDAVKLFGVELKDSRTSDGKTAGAQPPLVDPSRQPPEQDTPTFIYQGHNLILGQHQAQAITNTIQVGEGLPERIVALEGLEQLKNQDELVTDVIKTSKMFDATQEKLPKVIDITRLGLKQPVEYGIPENRSNRALLSGLLGLCERVSGRLNGLRSRLVLYKPELRATNVTADGHRLLLSRRPELALLADRPLAAVAPPDAVEASRAAAAPDLSPVSPFVHLHSRQQYDWGDVPPVAAACRHSHVHTLFLGWNSRLKKYVNDDQLGAVSVMMMYAAALNMSRQQADGSRPVVVQSVATDGRLFKLCVLQLNTTELPNPGSGEPSTRHQIKNMLWTEPAAPLYELCRYADGRSRLEGYNPEVFPRLLAFYMNGLIARTVDQI